MQLKKNIIAGKFYSLRFLLILVFLLQPKLVFGSIDDLEGNFLEIKILDKVSSKNSLLKIKIGEEKEFKNLTIKPLRCKNSEFDDNPEITAYLQVRDLTNKNRDEVFVFNGWTFSSGPTINPFDHPVLYIGMDVFLNEITWSFLRPPYEDLPALVQFSGIIYT